MKYILTILVMAGGICGCKDKAEIKVDAERERRKPLQARFDYFVDSVKYYREAMTYFFNTNNTTCYDCAYKKVQKFGDSIEYYYSLMYPTDTAKPIPVIKPNCNCQ